MQSTARENVRLSNAPRMILDSFVLVSDAEAEEGEGKPSSGSSCPGVENKRVVCLSVNWLYKEVYKHCDLLFDKQGTFFSLKMFFQACIDLYCLLIVLPFLLNRRRGQTEIQVSQHANVKHSLNSCSKGELGPFLLDTGSFVSVLTFCFC